MQTQGLVNLVQYHHFRGQGWGGSQVGSQEKAQVGGGGKGKLNFRQFIRLILIIGIWKILIAQLFRQLIAKCATRQFYTFYLENPNNSIFKMDLWQMHTWAGHITHLCLCVCVPVCGDGRLGLHPFLFMPRIFKSIISLTKN